MEAAIPRPVPRPRRALVCQAADIANNNTNSNNNVEEDPTEVKEKIVAKSPDANQNYVNVIIRNGDEDHLDCRNNNKSPTDKSNPYSDVILEISKLASAVPSAGPISNSNKVEKIEKDRPMPTPRQRQTRQVSQQFYENTEIKQRPAKETGAIKKQPLRAAPEPPASTTSVPTIDVSVPETKSASPVSDKRSSTSSINSHNIKRSSSTNTLDSMEGSEISAKYKTSSPGQIIKNIGASSRMLTEAITERVAHKTKGARKRILRTSKDTLSTLGTDATSTLKTVRDKLTVRMSNMSLGRAKEDGVATGEYDLERPVTVPSDDRMFKGIQFNSPLASKSKNSYNLVDSATYEVPHGALKCPSYEEAVADSSSATGLNFERNAAVTKSVGSELDRRGQLLAKPEKEQSLKRNNSETMLNTTDGSISSDSSEVERPCPSYPPPVLDLSPVYGQIRKRTFSTSEEEEDEAVAKAVPGPSSSAPKVPPPRHKHKSKTKDAGAVVAPVSSKPLGVYPQLDLSGLLPEKETQKCDSWAYYDTVSKDVAKSDWTTMQVDHLEPVYVNNENQYGTVFDYKALPEPLPPSAIVAAQTIDDILLEFDPLALGDGGGDAAAAAGTSASAITSQPNKSNHLLLLETLLSGETYGTIDAEDHQTEMSDDDNLNIDEAAASNSSPPPPTRVDSLTIEEEDVAQAVPPSPATRVTLKKRPQDGPKPVMIIHQNMGLRSDSMENIIDENDVERYLSQTDDTAVRPVGDLSRPPAQTSCFYVDGDVEETKAPVGPPPSYQDVLKEKAAKKEPTPVVSADVGAGPIEGKLDPKPTSMMTKFSNVFNKGLLRKTSFKTTAKPDVKTVLEMIPRAKIAAIAVNHEGHLVRIPTGVVEDILKEIQIRHSLIKNHKFYTFLNSEHKNPKESFPIDHITSIQSIVNQKVTTGQTDMHCFEVTVAVPKNQGGQHQQVNANNPNMVLTSTNSGNSKSTRICHVYGCVKQADRATWMQKFVENMTDVFPKAATLDFQRAGWCYLKNSISANWTSAWILLQRRKLLFYAEQRLDILDLRKARCIVLKECDDSINNLHVESGPTLMIDCPPFTLYFIMNCPRETKIWRNIIREEAHNNGHSLKNQQLTKDNIPVLVDKCINFIYTHGSMSEGIYRKSGSENQVAKLINAFREDAFSVQLTRTEYSEHDIATALKRFMRDLPEPLVGKYTVSFLAVSRLKNAVDKLASYEELLARLPTVEYQTLRKLLGHLHFIQSQKSKNKMGVENLSMLWGPTLMSDKNAEQVKYSVEEANVMQDFIVHYKHLFHPTEEETRKEEIMLAVLQKYHAAAENLSDSVKQSGDLKVWLQIDLDAKQQPQKATTAAPTDDNMQISVTLTPTKTVHEVFQEIHAKIRCEPYQLTLYEVILNGTLERPMHYREKVLDTVLRWTYWPDSDRRTNCLKVRRNKFMLDVERALKNMPTVHPADDLRYADPKTKTLKLYGLELNHGQVNVLKREKSGEIKTVKTIEVGRTLAFLGCEKKRDSACRWSITLIERDFAKRTRDSPFIGHILGGDNLNIQTIWYSCIMHANHGNDLMPTPEFL